jgi:hypothetical protein
VKVTFVKKERRYDVHVSRDRATDLFIRSAPGYELAAARPAPLRCAFRLADQESPAFSYR